jgi:FkbM family methyltransferase
VIQENSGDAEMSAEILSQLFEALPHLRDFHAPTDPAYGLLRVVARREIESKFAGADGKPQSFGPFGELRFPYEKMGAIDSLDLFGIDELVIFAFYWANRARYKKTLDLGANLGLHSIIMSRAGFNVTCFEPDPHHYQLLTRNLQTNAANSVTPMNAAVSAESGTLEFVRVLGNTTGSHLAGSKSNVYGGSDHFPVKVHAFKELIKGVDFVKLDIEGHEKVVLTATALQDWQHLDMMAEIGSPENAEAIFSHMNKIGVRMFAQKDNWHLVQKLDDMPTSHRNGSLFMTTKTEMPW